MVLDEDNNSDDVVGSAKVKFSALCIGKGVDEWFTILYDGSSAGKLHLKTVWNGDDVTDAPVEEVKAAEPVPVVEEKKVEVVEPEPVIEEKKVEEAPAAKGKKNNKKNKKGGAAATEDATPAAPAEPVAPVE